MVLTGTTPQPPKRQATLKVTLEKNSFEGWIVRAADGDTVIVLLKVRWGIWVERHCRILGIDSWELGGPHDDLAHKARLAIDHRFKMTPCIIQVSARGLDKYGRIRARIAVDGLDLATELCKMGVAWLREGKNALPTMPGASIRPATPSGLLPAVVGLILFALVGCHAPAWQGDGSVFVASSSTATNAVTPPVTINMPGSAAVEAHDRASVNNSPRTTTDNRPFSWRMLAVGIAGGVALAAVAFFALKAYKVI